MALLPGPATNEARTFFAQCPKLLVVAQQRWARA